MHREQILRMQFSGRPAPCLRLTTNLKIRELAGRIIFGASVRNQMTMHVHVALMRRRSHATRVDDAKEPSHPWHGTARLQLLLLSDQRTYSKLSASSSPFPLVATFQPLLYPRQKIFNFRHNKRI
jgi:hypothetical protein